MSEFKKPLFLLCFFVSIFLSTSSSLVLAEDKVSLQLKWRHAFQFAGYYAAKELGYYKDAGLDVDILAATPGLDPVTEVVEGRAHYGIGNSSLLIARQQGKPVVVLNVVFQHSAAVLIAKSGKRHPSVKDLLGQRVMIEPNSAELIAYLLKSGVSSENLTILDHSHQVQDLIDDKIDAFSAYSNYEPYLLNSKGFYFQVYTPREVGIDFYGDNLFTTEGEIENNPERVEAFRKASMRGWSYAMKHKKEIVDLIASKYAPGIDRQHLQFEAQKMNDLLVSDLIAVGHMNQDRWEKIVSTYQSIGQIEDTDILDGFIYHPYVSVWDRAREFVWLLLLASILILFLVYRNFQLKVFNKKLARIVNMDQLTGIYNRKYLDESLAQERDRSDRYGHTFSVIIADIDKFKEVNDEYGHHVGDDVLREIVVSLNQRVRSTDTLGRWGGEEFMLICPETELDEAVLVAESLRICIEQHDFGVPGIQTVSFGVATLCDIESVSDLVIRADRALYQAKRNGRNQVKGISNSERKIPG